MEYNREFKEEWYNDGSNHRYIYHFTSIESLIKILLTDTFRLNLVERMNDINESQPIHKRFGIKIDRDELREIAEIEDEIRSRTFLGCFNSLKQGENIRDKVSMWGHYADAGKGVCLKIDKEKFDEILFDKVYDRVNNSIECGTKIFKFDVSYKGQDQIDKDKIRYLRNNGEQKLPHYINVKRMFKCKSIEWTTENEFRYLLYNERAEKVNYFKIKKISKCIDCIYIGDIQDKESITLLKSIKERLARDIDFYIRDGYLERRF